VTYGASPHTSIAARAHDILESMNHLPAAVARAAMERLQARADLVQQPLAASQNGESVPASQNGTAEERTQPEMVGQSEPASTGRSVFLARKQLLLETE
jgi:hypothetical protein